jgi:bifunctional DNA-binding transcriptional regulator/antitoxin component of YhaV-PrlF toxin-antitoxin module
MSITIQMDASGRLVLPKAVRVLLNLSRGAMLRAEVIAGRIELVPVSEHGSDVVVKRGGVSVLKRTGRKVDAAAAVADERAAQEGRGTRR